MSGLYSERIVTAIRERLDGTLTGVRAMSPGELDRGAYPGIAPAELARRALNMPVIDVRITDIARNQDVLSELGDYNMLRVEFVVTAAYQIPSEVLADDRLADLVTIRATAADDAEQIRQSVSYPGGLAYTAASLATGIISGCAMHLGTSTIEEDAVGGLLRLEHRFYAIVGVSPATS